MSLQGGVNGNMNQGCDSVVVSRQSQAHSRGDNDKIIQNKISPNSFQF
jgi:hypothetical protein